MKILKFVFLLLVVLVLIGCKTTEKSVKTSETIKEKNKVVEVDKKTTSNLSVKMICDSIGNVSPIYYTLYTEKDSIVLKTVKNTLDVLVTKKADTTTTEKTSEIQTIKEFVEIEKEIFKTPAWKNNLLIISLILNIISIGFFFFKSKLN